jgi:hypothetical protein
MSRRVKREKRDRDEINKAELKRLNQRKQRITLILEAVIIVLLLVLIPFLLNVMKTTDTVQSTVCPVNTGAISLDCSDGDPCTMDVKTLLPTTECSGSQVSTQSCVQYACQHIKMANGSCCNSNDFCYTDDPNKKCVLGECITDPLLCKGYCTNHSSQCPELPFIVQDYYTSVSTACYSHACVYTVTVEMYIADPYSLLYDDPLDMTYFNISSCLVASCDYRFLTGLIEGNRQLSICTFGWSCAPLLFPKNSGGKRKRGFEGVDDASSSSNISSMTRIPHIGVKRSSKLSPSSLMPPDPSTMRTINITNESTWTYISYPQLSYIQELEVNHDQFVRLQEVITEYEQARIQALGHL